MNSTLKKADKASARGARQSSRFFRTCRLFLASGALTLLCTVWARAQIQSSAETRALHFGATFLDLLSAAGRNLSLPVSSQTATEITVNGLRLRIQTGSLSAEEYTLGTFLEHAYARCPEPQARVSESSATPPSSAFKAPVFRAANDQAGYVFCLAPHKPLTYNGLLAFAEDFVASSDLSELGTFRGVYVKREGTHLVALSAELLDGFVPGHMFPEHGDSPGADLLELPRPRGRRTLSVSHLGQVSLCSYEVSLPADVSLKEYLSSLEPEKVKLLRPEQDGAVSTRSAALKTENATFLITSTPIPNASALHQTESILLLARLPT